MSNLLFTLFVATFASAQLGRVFYLPMDLSVLVMRFSFRKRKFRNHDLL